MALPAKADAPSAPDWSWVGVRQPPLNLVTPVAPNATVAQSPHAGIYAGYFSPLNCRFKVPDGTYTVRIHYLQAKGPTKNMVPVTAIANGVTIVAGDQVWLPLRVYPEKQNPTVLPDDVVAIAKEAQVTAKGGEIVVFFPRSTPTSGINAVEVIGAKESIRISSGGPTPYVDAEGNHWEPVSDHRGPIPISDEFSIAAPVTAKGQWTKLSDDIFKAMGDQVQLAPMEFINNNYIVADYSGNTYFTFSKLGIWRYDDATGHLQRVDGGKFTGLAAGGVSLNVDGPGFYECGWEGEDHNSFAVRSMNGVDFESIMGTYPRQNGTDWVSVDWTSNPQLFYIKVHDVHGKTALSTDGGKTYHDISDDGMNLAAIGAVGNNVLLRYLRDGSVMRSADLGVTWAPAIQLSPKIPLKDECFYSSGGFIRRYGDSVFLSTIKGDFFVSKDAGLTWTVVENAPAFTQELVRGKTANQLIGFAGNTAWSSDDNGMTWTKIMDAAPGPAWGDYKDPQHPSSHYSWAYDRTRDVFYYADSKGAIYRYAR